MQHAMLRFDNLLEQSDWSGTGDERKTSRDVQNDEQQIWNNLNPFHTKYSKFLKNHISLLLASNTEVLKNLPNLQKHPTSTE